MQEILNIFETMRPTIPYSAEELLNFAELQDSTKDAAEELEESFLNILENHGLNKHEVLFTLARVVDSFIRMEEDFEFDESKRIDAEAVFNDYYTACRDIQNAEDAAEDPVTNKEGN